jgi:hypothetical protein
VPNLSETTIVVVVVAVLLLAVIIVLRKRRRFDIGNDWLDAGAEQDRPSTPTKKSRGKFMRIGKDDDPS